MLTMSSSAITQRISLDLKPVVQIEDKLRALNEILSDVEGFEDLYWGHNVAALDQLEILLLWCSPDSLDMYGSTPEREAVDNILQDMSDSAPTTHRLSFQPPPSLLCSPVIELLLLYSLPESSTPATFEHMVSFIKSTDGCLGVVAGPAADDDDGLDEDVLGNAFLVIAGWESIEANEKGAKSEGFKKLPKVEGTKVMLKRVRFQKFRD